MKTYTLKLNEDQMQAVVEALGTEAETTRKQLTDVHDELDRDMGERYMETLNALVEICNAIEPDEGIVVPYITVEKQDISDYVDGYMGEACCSPDDIKDETLKAYANSMRNVVERAWDNDYIGEMHGMVLNEIAHDANLIPDEGE
jgi:hypothetical protein